MSTQLVIISATYAYPSLLSCVSVRMDTMNWAELPREVLLYVVAPFVAAASGGNDAPAARAALAYTRASCRSWRHALNNALRSLTCCFAPRSADALALLPRCHAPPTESARLWLTGVTHLRLSRLPPSSWIHAPSSCAWSSLCTLDFSDCHWLGGAALDSLARAVLPCLRTLSFARCRSPDLRTWTMQTVRASRAR